ncbi:MAG TPA: Ig-like domain-containing protein [Firmicutes bacterium]|nr:Ig-like domain-containing protein [Bacillota bacterium]
MAWQVWQKRGQVTPPPAGGGQAFTAQVTPLAGDRVRVEFSAAVDPASAGATARYRIVPATGLQVAVPVTAVQVAADKRSVDLTTGTMTGGNRYLLTLLDVADAGGGRHTLSLAFTASSLPAPPAQGGVTVLGPTSLKVTFDKELDPGSLAAGAAGNFTLVLAGTAFSPGVVSEATLAAPREVLLTVPALEANKEYTLSVYNVRDNYGQKLSSSPLNFTFTVRPDTQAPELVSVKSTGPGTLELTFSEEVDPDKAADTSRYRVRESGAQPQAALPYGRTVTLLFSTPLATGATYTLDVEEAVDRWDNRSAATARSFTVQPDTFAPRVLSAAGVTNTAVEVRFNENLAGVGSFVLERDGRSVDVARAEQVAPGLVRLSAYLGRSGRYRLEAAGAVDAAGNRAAAQVVYFSYDGTETGRQGLPPEVVAVKTGLSASDQVEVTFSQPLDAASAEKTRNYRLTLAEDLSTAIAIDEATLDADDKTVHLTLDEPLEAGVSYRYFISGVEDDAGEEMIPAAGYFVAGSGSGFISRVAALDARRVEVSFNQDVQGQYTSSNYGLVEKATGRLIPIVGVESGGAVRRVVLVLGQDLEEDEDYTFSAGNTLSDSSGRTLPTFTAGFRARFTAPVRLRLRDIEPVDSRSFRLTFSKPVAEVKVRLSGYSLEYEYYGPVVLVRANKSFTSGESYRLDVWARDRDNPPQEIDWERETLEYSGTSQGTELTDVVAATSQRVKVEFSGPLDADTASDPDNYYLRVGSSSGPLFAPVRAEYDPARFVVWLYLPASAALGEERYYLSLDGVEDALGNRFDPDDSYRFDGVDTVPPVVVLPYLPNQEGQPVVLRAAGGTVSLVGGPGAVEGDAYLRLYVDDKLIKVARAEEDGSFAALDLGALSGRHTLRLVVTDTAGNSGERSQVYDL